MSQGPLKQPAHDAASDLEWCYDAVQGVSRTFAITIEVLEEPMSSYICVGYLICRIADTVEDAGHIPPAAQAEILRTFDGALDPESDVTVEDFLTEAEPYIPAPDERNEDWQVVAAAPRVLRTFHGLPGGVQTAIRSPARELVQGMVTFVERYAHRGGLRIQTPDELEEYCYYAAGTVGLLITNLVCRDGVSEKTQKRLYATAESFGLLLQLVNIAKDVYDDFRHEDNVYLPARWLADEGVDQEAVTDEPEGTKNVVSRTAGYARQFIDDAQTYLEVVPEVDGNRLAAWAIPFLLAVGTLRELGNRPEDAVNGSGVKVSREEVHAVIAATTGEADAEDLAELRETVDERPLHEASEVPGG